MPKPQAGESQDEFLERCIPQVIDDGTAEDSEQAAAICYSLWEQHENGDADGDGEMESEGSKMIHKTMPIKVESKTANGGRITISTGDLDRQRDRVMPFGARIDNYLKNPVVQYGHNYHEPWATVGRTTSIEITNDGIIADFELRPAANEQDPQNIIRLLWDGEWIRTASVGFNPLNREENELGGFDFTEWELLEWSLVPVPANQSALRMAVKALNDEEAITPSQKPPEPELAEISHYIPVKLPDNAVTTTDVIDDVLVFHEQPADVTEPINDVTDAEPISDDNELDQAEAGLLQALDQFLDGLRNLLT